MKNKNAMKKYILNMIAAIGALSMWGGCSDFEEINQNPNAVGEEDIQVEYFLNRSIFDAQMNPHIAERIWIIYWDRVSGYEARNTLTLFLQSNDYNTDYYGGSYLNRWIKDVTLAVELAKGRLDNPAFPNANNMYQIARIWRAYLLSEMTDNFGPVPLSNYDGTPIVEMKSVEEVYAFILTELSEASDGLNLGIEPNDSEWKNDIMYGANSGTNDGTQNTMANHAAAWQKYANSMTLRYAMRIGNQAAFEAAAAKPLITELTDIASVQEGGGWDAITGVMSRPWNPQQMSRTYASLVMGLGGIDIATMAALNGNAVSGADMAALAPYLKDPNAYLGADMSGNYLPTKTNRVDAPYFFDAIPNNIDPRALVNFSVPGFALNDVNNYEMTNNFVKMLLPDSTNAEGFPVPSTSVADTLSLRAQYTYHTLLPGNSATYASNFSFTSGVQNLPTKSKAYRSGTKRRIFFAPWETHFLLAEGALKGWATGTTAQAAYEAGVTTSFAHLGIASLATSYLASTSYNRNGTSAAWNHTAEAAPVSMQGYVLRDNLEADGTKKFRVNDSPTMLDITYTYPTGAYSTNNDALTKIITQKYLANSPWLPLEAWSDYRRLNLPFMENPVLESANSSMPWYTGAMWEAFQIDNIPQRISYPSNLATNNAEAYNSGVALLGGKDDISTALPWAKQ